LFRAFTGIIICLVLACCQPGIIKKQDLPMDEYTEGTIGYDISFLKKHDADLILLQEGEAIVAVSPTLQGRVMTSSANGFSGKSFGWINYDFYENGGEISSQFHPYGGEERFWLGPEGGQFSLFFSPGSEFEFEHWKVPPAIDTDPFELVRSGPTEAHFRKQMELINFTGTRLNIGVERTVTLLGNDAVSQLLGVSVPESIGSVGFTTDNTITNNNDFPWTRETGTISIWILSMLNASPECTVVAPYRQGPEAELGPIVTDDYFNRPGEDRLKAHDGVIYFKADSQFRSKIGLSPRRALPFCGSYDPASGTLTIAHYSLPEGKSDYVNSLWEIQDQPFKGDAVNAYNDGPVDGSQLGHFYEIESSSPAAFLEPGNSLRHTHTTIHLKGHPTDLDPIARKIFGVSLTTIENALP
jgi:hypothetical protein